MILGISHSKVPIYFRTGPEHPTTNIQSPTSSGGGGSKATQSHLKATPRPPQGHILGIDSGGQSHPKATPRPPQGHPKATPRLPQGYPKATPRLPQSPPPPLWDRNKPARGGNVVVEL